MQKAIWLVTVMFGLISMAGCNETQQCAANCGWVMRAQEQAQIQDTSDPDEAYFAQYEQTFKLNERMYYRTDPGDMNTAGHAYAWTSGRQVESNQDIR